MDKKEENYLVEIQEKLRSTSTLSRATLFSKYSSFSEEQLKYIHKQTSFLDRYEAKLSERVYCVAHDIHKLLICPVCGIDRIKFKSYDFGYYKVCSKKCADIRRKSIEYQENIKKTCLKKYGVDNTAKSERAKNTYRENCLRKYGVTSFFKSDDFKEKSEKTFLKNYGKIKVSQIPEIHEKASISRKKNFYGKLFDSFRLNNEVEPLFSLEEYVASNGVYAQFHFKCKKCGAVFLDTMEDGSIPRCPICYPKTNGFSYSEKEIVEYLRSLGINKINENDRSLIRDPKTGNVLELDLVVPEYNLTIEFNGIYYHNADNKNRNYHKLKVDLCNEKGYSLITVWEDAWKDPIKKEIYKSLILNKLGKLSNKLYARKCEIKEIDEGAYSSFLNYNHIQGYSSAKIKLGLFYKNDLVSIMSFSKPRFNKKYQYEMIRYCNKIYTSVIGGASKLFKYFIANYKPISIISYSSNDISSGKIYEKLLFHEEKPSTPNYFYAKLGSQRFSRMHFQKHKLKDLLKNYHEELSEYENMKLNGYFKIYDSGNKVFSWKGEK